MANILLVEDYLSLQQIYKETLELDKHTVSVAANVTDALALTKKHTFDVILLDLLLQDTWGIDFLKEFEPAKHPETKIIVISNMYTNQVLNNALQLGAIHYLVKSEVTPKQLAEVVHDTVEAAKKKPLNP